MSDLMVTFSGLDADAGHLDVFSGVESMAGIARALTLIAHYCATGEVRHRFPFTDDVKFFLEGTEEGSFKWRLRLFVAAAASNPLAINLASNVIYDISKLVITRAIGQEPKDITQDVQSLDRAKGGDINALVEAIEPALKKGHYGVGGTANSVTISEEYSKKIIIKFDQSSKDFLLQDIHGDDSSQQVSISALNANDGTGRAYFLDLHRTVPFRVSKSAKEGTLSTLSSSLDAYVNDDPAPVEISFERIETADGRLKRIVIFEARNVAGTQ